MTVRLSQRPDVVIVEVRDDGIGFDPQGAEVRSRHLGLTSMEERARELGGRLEIRSAPGSGTTVLYWSRAMADAIRVLLVDDHAVVREGLRTFLALQDGLEIVGEASDGDEAIEQAQRLGARRDPDGSGDAGARRRRRDATAARPIAGQPRDRAHELPRGRARAAGDPGRRRRLPAQERRARRARPRDPRGARRRGDHRPDGRGPARARDRRRRPPAGARSPSD